MRAGPFATRPPVVGAGDRVVDLFPRAASPTSLILNFAPGADTSNTEPEGVAQPVGPDLTAHRGSAGRAPRGPARGGAVRVACGDRAVEVDPQDLSVGQTRGRKGWTRDCRRHRHRHETNSVPSLATRTSPPLWFPPHSGMLSSRISSEAALDGRSAHREARRRGSSPRPGWQPFSAQLPIRARCSTRRCGRSTRTAGQQ